MPSIILVLLLKAEQVCGEGDSCHGNWLLS